ncbi:FAD-binding protein [Temperatibacter marinus]|uniref:FAD-binding protein n=1 Tax=Temperatibacter marinus TaxID=1456591 RepID=A0AA52EJ37_9PROT|nr:FAD-binding protein [Temperatibacter marinus]WND02966.1 FAD-binding protein [Temperatibacter marinus]
MTLQRLHYDVIVVGSGMAGAAAANQAMKEGARVLVVSKDPLICSDTKISEGIITVRESGSEKDTVEELANNMQTGGSEIGDTSLSQIFAENSQDAHKWLSDNGLRSRTDPKTGKPIALGVPMGGHSLPRSVDHENGGLDHAQALLHALIAEGKIDTIEDAWFLDLYISNQKNKSICGGLLYHATKGTFISIVAPSVIIACGGLSTLYYPHTDTMRGNTGDSFALAARAGAQLVDMEHIQFIPFAIATPGSYQGLVIGEPVTTGILGVLKDKDGNEIANNLMTMTRAEASAIIAQAVAAGKGTENEGCYLDLTPNMIGQSGALFKRIYSEKFPTVLKTVKKALGPKAARIAEAWEVSPSAHYCMGGIRVTSSTEVLDSEQKVIEGLYAAGQALGGLHGSNRLGSTSLSEGAIFGQISGKRAAQHHRSSTSNEDIDQLEKKHYDFYSSKLGQQGDTAPIHVQRNLQSLAWTGIGPARDSASLNKVLSGLETVRVSNENSSIPTDHVWNQSFIDYVETRNLSLCAEVIASSALVRTKSTGAHVRLDEDSFPSDPMNYAVTSFYLDGKVFTAKLERALNQSDFKEAQSQLHNQKRDRHSQIARMPLEQQDPLLCDVYNSFLGDAP